MGMDRDAAQTGERPGQECVFEARMGLELTLDASNADNAFKLLAVT